MDIRTALKGQYKAGLAMLRDCIVKCPDDVWVAGMPIITPDPGGRTNQEREARTFWRVAYHCLFYTHLYSMPREEDFVAWARHDDLASNIWIGPDEPIPPKETTYSQADLLGYLDWMVTQVDGWVDALDLSSPESGFYWYKEFPKLDHQILNVRHIGVHVGQLSERLMLAGVDTDWVSRGRGRGSGSG
ncbi:MAG: hypothetical protein WD716_05670 [Fimbriimonadaceae bacterium]